MILSKEVPVDEIDMVDYLIDGIPCERLRELAKVKKFQRKEDVLQIFREFPLSLEVRI